jgi:hypothetical protein
MLKYPKQVEAIPFDLPETVFASWSLKGVNNTNFDIFTKVLHDIHPTMNIRSEI